MIGNKFFRNKWMLLFLLSMGSFVNAFSQGDGPRNLLWAPTGVTGFIPKWMNMNQNITPGNVLVEDADVTINAFPMTLIHNFNIGGRFAQVMANANPGNADGTLQASAPNLPAPVFTASGFADGFVGIKMGLVNQPALNVIEYSQYKHKTFSMMGYFRLWYSGTYNVNDALNMGSNRLTFEMGLPMDIYLSKNPKRPTWLEIYPSISFYTMNNDPTTITMANSSQQKPLFAIENHLSHNFTDKFWASADLRYTYGGDLKLDGISQDNTINMLGGGATVGYQVLSMLGINAGYGTIFAGDNGATSDMIRLTAVLSYANTKKLTPSFNN